MASLATILASVTKFLTASDKAHAIVNGPASGTGSTVTVESGVLPTFAKKLADFTAEGLPVVLPIYDPSGMNTPTLDPAPPAGTLGLMPLEADGNHLLYWDGTTWLCVNTNAYWIAPL